MEVGVQNLVNCKRKKYSPYQLPFVLLMFGNTRLTVYNPSSVCKEVFATNSIFQVCVFFVHLCKTFCGSSLYCQYFDSNVSK